MRVLIADDDRDLAEVLATYVREMDHEVVATVTSGGLAVIQSFGRYQPDVVLLDIMMPKFNGLTVCHALISRDPAAKVIFISGSVKGDHPFVSNAGAIGYLEKPIDKEKLRGLLESAGSGIVSGDQ